MTQVDNTITLEDELAINQMLGPFTWLEADNWASFKKEVSFISKVQNRVLGEVPVNAGIPHGMPREPDDLLSRGEGLCFDRSRFIEKALRLNGFETRHIAIYSIEETDSAVKSLLTPQVSSHAVTEVKTTKGWMVVDSNEPWLALDREYQPLSIAALADMGNEEQRQQLLSMPGIPIYAENFTFVYGLYSRHGMFYPPYDHMPDIHLSEFVDNLWRLAL